MTSSHHLCKQKMLLAQLVPSIAPGTCTLVMLMFAPGYRCFYCCTAPRNPLRRSSASLAWHIHRCPKFAWPTAAPEQTTANKILFAWVPNSPINVAQFCAIHFPSADQLVDPAKDSEPPGAIPKVPYFPLAMNFRSRWPRESDESLPNFPANDACRSHF
jgi:hypothetical protein